MSKSHPKVGLGANGMPCRFQTQLWNDFCPILVALGLPMETKKSHMATKMAEKSTSGEHLGQDLINM